MALIPESGLRCRVYAERQGFVRSCLSILSYRLIRSPRRRVCHLRKSKVTIRGVGTAIAGIVLLVGLVCESGVLKRNLGTAIAGLTRVHRCKGGAGLVGCGLAVDR